MLSLVSLAVNLVIFLIYAYKAKSGHIFSFGYFLGLQYRRSSYCCD